MKQLVTIPPSCNPRIKEPDARFFHSLPLQIRFNDIDILGHLNNSVYMEMMDLGKATYFNEVLGSLVDWHEVNVAIVNINVNFLAPTFITDNIMVITRMKGISKHSLTLEQRIVESTLGEVKCQAQTIMAGYNIKTASSMPIDPEWVKAFSQWEETDFSIECII